MLQLYIEMWISKTQKKGAFVFEAFTVLATRLVKSSENSIVWQRSLLHFVSQNFSQKGRLQEAICCNGSEIRYGVLQVPPRENDTADSDLFVREKRERFPKHRLHASLVNGCHLSAAQSALRLTGSSFSFGKWRYTGGTCANKKTTFSQKGLF